MYSPIPHTRFTVKSMTRRRSKIRSLWRFISRMLQQQLKWKVCLWQHAHSLDMKICRQRHTDTGSIRKRVDDSGKDWGLLYIKYICLTFLLWKLKNKCHEIDFINSCSICITAAFYHCLVQLMQFWPYFNLFLWGIKHTIASFYNYIIQRCRLNTCTLVLLYM